MIVSHLLEGLDTRPVYKTNRESGCGAVVYEHFFTRHQVVTVICQERPRQQKLQTW